MDYVYRPRSRELYHYGVKGMKWGVRRYQNKDGSLINAGKRRLNKEYREEMSSYRSDLRRKYNKEYGVDAAYNKADKKFDKLDNDDPYEAEKIYSKAESLSKKSYDAVESEMRRRYGEDYDRFVKYEQNFGAAVVVGGIALSGLAMYGTTKVIGLAGEAIVNAGAKAVEKLLK